MSEYGEAVSLQNTDKNIEDQGYDDKSSHWCTTSTLSNEKAESVEKYEKEFDDPICLGWLKQESYSAPRAKRGGPNKLNRMALTTWDFTYTWVTKKTHFLQLLIIQARNIIFKVFQSPKLTTHHVLLTGAIGTLQYGILHTPESPKKPTFCKCLYLRLETTFLRSSKAKNPLLIMYY